MPDKDQERFYLEALLRAQPELAGNSIVEGETPDFVLGEQPSRIGVELTKFFLPPQIGQRPHQEQQSLRDRVVEHAARIFTAAGGPALYVDVISRDDVNLSRRSVDEVAPRIVEALVRSSLPRTLGRDTLDVSSALLPPEVSHLRADASFDGKDKLWSADWGGWVADIPGSAIQGVLDRKREVLARARKKCDRLWLVVVHDAFCGGAPAELTDEVLQQEFRFDCDRVLWLSPHAARTLEFQRATA